MTNQLLNNVYSCLQVGSDWFTLFASAFCSVFLFLTLKSRKDFSRLVKIIILGNAFLITFLYYLYDFLGMTVTTHSMIATGFNISTVFNLVALIVLTIAKKKDKPC
jgi:hypothetical protein